MAQKKHIGELLLEFGLVRDEDLQEGLKLQKKSGQRLGEALVKLGKVTMEDIEWVLSKQLDIPFVIVEDIQLDNDLMNKFPKDMVIDGTILPVYENDEEIMIVTDDPFNKEAIESVERLLQKKVSVSSGGGEKIREALMKFYKKEGTPILISHIEETRDKIQDTSFYRIDFLLSESLCTINIFGFSILKSLCTITETFTREQILSAFSALDISFLYDEFTNNNRTFLSVYPLLNEKRDIQHPAIIGRYGLVRPEDTAFVDAQTHDLPACFYAPEPVEGYVYLSTKRRDLHFEKTIYTIDSGPIDFKDYYVNMFLPRKCQSCQGKGCQDCKDLGYEFNEIEGVYSSEELKKLSREG